MLSALATRGVCAAVVMTAHIPKTKARKLILISFLSLASKLDHLLVERDTRNPAFKRKIEFYARFAVIRSNNYRKHIVVALVLANDSRLCLRR